MTQNPLLSIVITSYTTTRLKDIYELFDSIKHQTYQNIEVIFVADQSEELARRAEDCLKELQTLKFKVLLNKGEIGVNTCRNLGIRASHGEIVGLVDDDVILFPDWAEEMVRSYLEDDEVVGVTGPAIPLWDDPQKMSWFPKELYFVWACTVWDWDKKREIRNVGGMNCSFKREALFKAGLYNHALGPKEGGAKSGKWLYVGAEEIDLSLRIRKFTKGKIIYNPKVKIYHRVPKRNFSLISIMKRCLHFGYTKGYVKKQFKASSNEPILKLEYEHLKRILFSSTWRFLRQLFKNPYLALKSFIMTLLVVFFTGLGYLAYNFKPYSEGKR